MSFDFSFNLNMNVQNQDTYQIVIRITYSILSLAFVLAQKKNSIGIHDSGKKLCVQ